MSGGSASRSLSSSLTAAASGSNLCSVTRPVDRLFVHCKELLTLADGPAAGLRRGAGLRDVGLILDGAIAVHDGRVVATGSTEAMRADYSGGQELDLSGFVVLPGLVDAHTHPVFVEPDAEELTAVREGGEHRTGRDLERVVRGVREASLEQLTEATRAHLDTFVTHGTTTVEAKTGYGLEMASEVKGLRALAAAAKRVPLAVHRTFLCAHVLDAAHRADPDAFVRRVVDEMPQVRELCESCDVHVQPGGLPRDAARSILMAARELGLRLRMLADVEPVRGVELGVELGVSSVDHLAGISVAGLEQLADSDTAAVLLPGTVVGSGAAAVPARMLIDSGCAVALGTDFHPLEAAPCSMVLVMALACTGLAMLPDECVTAATLNAAATLGLDHSVGSLHAGKRADFVALDLPSYRALGDVLDGGPVPLVVIEGHPVVTSVQERDPGL